MSLLSKVNDIDTSNIHINNDLVKISRWAYQWKMSFNPDIKSKQQKYFFFFSKEFFKRLPLILSRKQLLTIEKAFVRSLLDYADIIYDKSFSDSLIRAIKSTSRERLYKELGL